MIHIGWVLLLLIDVDSMPWQIIFIGCVLLLLYISVLLLLLLIYVGSMLERWCGLLLFLQGDGERTQEALKNKKTPEQLEKEHGFNGVAVIYNTGTTR